MHRCSSIALLLGMTAALGSGYTTPDPAPDRAAANEAPELPRILAKASAP